MHEYLRLRDAQLVATHIRCSIGCRMRPQHYRHIEQHKVKTRKGRHNAVVDLNMDGTVQTRATSVSNAPRVASTASTLDTFKNAPC